MEAGRLVDGGIEPGVCVGVGDVQDRFGLGDVARDALVGGEPDLPRALGHLAPQLVLVLVQEEDAAAGGIDHRPGMLHDFLEQDAEVPFRGHSLGHVQDRLKLLNAPFFRVQVRHACLPPCERPRVHFPIETFNEVGYNAGRYANLPQVPSHRLG